MKNILVVKSDFITLMPVVNNVKLTELLKFFGRTFKPFQKEDLKFNQFSNCMTLILEMGEEKHSAPLAITRKGSGIYKDFLVGEIIHPPEVQEVSVRGLSEERIQLILSELKILIPFHLNLDKSYSSSTQSSFPLISTNEPRVPPAAYLC